MIDLGLAKVVTESSSGSSISNLGARGYRDRAYSSGRHRQVFKIVSNLTQKNQELVALFGVQVLNGEHGQTLALAMESSMDGVSSTGQLKSNASPICLLILLYTQ
jgi:hypothetical protein